MPALAHNSATYPVFVMGAARSGTSTVATYLRENMGYKGFPEGHIFDLVYKLNSCALTHFSANGFRLADSSNQGYDMVKEASTAAELISLPTITREINDCFKRLIDGCYSDRWYDKTPGPEFILAAPLMLSMYPNARFIFMIRHPASAIASHMRKFASSFDAACNHWRSCSEGWLQVKQFLPEGSYIELKTHELSSDPVSCAHSILTLLSPESSMDLSTHLLSPGRGKFLEVERTSMGDLSTVGSLDTLGLSSENRIKYDSLCKPLADYFFSQGSQPKLVNQGKIKLPLPVGQLDVEVQHGEKGGVWPQVHNDEICIFMHPSANGVATSVTYKHLALSGSRVLRAVAYLISQNAQPVIFFVSAVDENNLEKVCESSIICTPNSSSAIAVPILLPGESVISLTLGTRSSDPSASNAWALISCPILDID